MKRRSFIAALLAAPAAVFALIRSAKAQPVSEAQATARCSYPRATTCYQRLYTKLEYRPNHSGDRSRSFWINGTSANGERDVFHQHQRKTCAGWETSVTYRYSHRDDTNNVIISYPKRHVNLTLDIVPVTKATAPWMKDIVAIARWTETEGRA